MTAISQLAVSIARFLFLALPLSLCGSALGDATEAELAASPTQSQPPDYTVAPRLDRLTFYPCADCHEFMDRDDTVRPLDIEEGHPERLEHGGGQFWCLNCHDPNNYAVLRNALGPPLDFNSGFLVCRTCHSDKFRDWSGGAHGKRLTKWQGERQLKSCVECHNPHKPAIAPRAPMPAPHVRKGLEPLASTHAGEADSRSSWRHQNEKEKPIDVH